MTRRPSAQTGVALIDALIASAVLGIGLAGTAQLTLKTYRLATENRQHTVAQLLAEEAMNCWLARAQACPVKDDIRIQGVRYSRQVQSTPRDGGWVLDLQVRVEWSNSGTTPDPLGRSQQVSADHQRILWHSSASAIPLWVGVSSP